MDGAIQKFHLRRTLLTGAFMLILGLAVGSVSKLGSAQDRESQVATSLASYVQRNITDNELLGKGLVRLGGDTFTFNIRDDIASQYKAFEKTKQSVISNRDVTTAEALLAVIGPFVQGTRFQDKVQINRSPKIGYLNLYFLKADPANIAGHFQDNCVYVGYQDSVLCDAAFLRRRMQSLVDLPEYFELALVDTKTGQRIALKDLPADARNVINNTMRIGFLTWFLGHEIGHAVLHHDFVIRTGRQVHFEDPQYDERELQADTYVATSLSRGPSASNTFWLALSEFIEQEYRKEVAVLAPSGRAQEIAGMDSDHYGLRYKLTLNYSTYNMPLLIRALRIVDALTRGSNELDTTGYFQRVRANISLQRSHVDRVFKAMVLAAAPILVACAAILLFRVKQKGHL